MGAGRKASLWAEGDGMQGLGKGQEAAAEIGADAGDLGLNNRGTASNPESAADGLMPGQRLARGVARALRALDFASLEEMIPTPGLRVDLMALGPKGEIWVIECKSSRADYAADRKWQGYLEFCDRFFWAVDGDFPTDILPGQTGLIRADAWDAEIIRMGDETPLVAPRRKALTLKFARQAAGRLQVLRDPGPR